MEGKEKIVLKDGTEIEIENGASQNCVQIVFQDLDGFKGLHAKFTEANLENYKILNAEGLTCADISNKYLKSTLVEQKENGFLISFNLADVDMLEKRVAALEAEQVTIKSGQELQDGAIADLGSAVSDIAEGGAV